MDELLPPKFQALALIDARQQHLFEPIYDRFKSLVTATPGNLIMFSSSSIPSLKVMSRLGYTEQNYVH